MSTVVPTGAELFSDTENYITESQEQRHGRKPEGTSDQGRRKD